MVDLCRGIGQAGANIFCFQIGVVTQDLLRGRAMRKHVKNIAHANAHSPDAGAATALAGVERDAIQGHAGTITNAAGGCK